MPYHASSAGLPDLDRIQACHSTNETSSTNHQDDWIAFDGAHIIWTSPDFRCPNLSIPQSQPEPGQETIGTLHLPPSALVPDQDHRAAYDSESEHSFAFQSPKAENKTFYDTVRDTSSAPTMASSGRPEMRTSPAPKGCACGSPWHSEPDEEGLESFHPDNGTPSSTQLPAAPANSPHEEPRRVDDHYHGPPGSSSEWPHYWKPTIEDEEEEAINCYDADMRNDVERAAALPRSLSSDWLEGQLERKKNASSSSIHANVQSIDDVKKCPAAHLAKNVDGHCSDSELKYWAQKCQEMLEEIQQVDAWQAQFPQPPALIPSRSHIDRVREAEIMVDLMDRRGFKPTPKWLAEYACVAELAERGNTYPLMAFVIAEFGEFFSRDLKSASEDHQSQGLLDLDTATNKGAIDACQAVKSLMSIGGLRPTDEWCEQYDALTANAQDCGDIEPLIEFVRCEAKNISVRSVSERATKAKESLRPNYNIIDLDESGTQIRSSPKNGPELGYDDDQKGKDLEYSQHNVRHEYGVWLHKNYQSATESFGNKFFYIANSMHPIVARLDNFETRQPFVVTLSHYLDEFRLLASVSIVALAVKVTPSEKNRSADTYAEVWLRDSEYCEKFDSPSRVQGLSAQGEPFNLDEQSIIAMIESKLGDHFDATAPEDGEFNTASVLQSNDSSSSSASGTTLRRRDSDQSESQSPPSVRQSHIHLSPKETQYMHPNVVAERGMTLVPLYDFPNIPEDPYNLTHYQLSIGAPPTSVFVNCERCHKTLASFDNVEAEPTVVRREEDKPGDTYIVRSISSLDIIDSVDKVKRIWLQVGTHKYFMRANEAGVERTHECISIQDTPRAAMEPENREAAAGYYTQDDEETTLGYDRFGDLQPQAPCAHGRQPFFEEEKLGYDRLGDLPAYKSGQPRDNVQLPPSEDHQSQPQTIPSVRMPSNMQFLPLHPNFPTAELTSVREPCTIISVCEQRGIIHGVYQGVIGYRAIFRGPGERGHKVYLDIRDGMGNYIGRLTCIRHYEVGLMNGQVSTFTVEEEPEERMKPMPFPHQSASAAQSNNIGLRGGAPIKDCADTEADMYWPDEEMGLRGAAGVEYSDSDDDGTNGEPRKEWISTGTTIGTTAAPPQSQQTASISASQSSGHPKGEWIPAGVSAQQSNQQAPASTSQSGVDEEQTWKPTALSAEQPKAQQKRCNCLSRKGKEPVFRPSVPPAASFQPPRIEPNTTSTDFVAPSQANETAWDFVYGGAPEVVSTHNQQGAGSMGRPSSSKDKEKDKELATDFRAASAHQVLPSENPPRLPQDGSERIPSWLQPSPQSDPDQKLGEEPVFSESYKKWLRDMYTRSSNSTCGTTPNAGPGFQDFWKDREASYHG